MESDYRVSRLEGKDFQEINERIQIFTVGIKERRPNGVGVNCKGLEPLEGGSGVQKILQGFVLKQKSVLDSSYNIVGYTFYDYAFSAWSGRYIIVSDIIVFPGTDQNLKVLLTEKLLELVKADNLVQLDFEVSRKDLPTSRLVAIGATPLSQWYTVEYSNSAVISLTRGRNEEVRNRYHIRMATQDDMESVLYLIQCLAEYHDEASEVKINVEDLVQGLGKHFHCLVVDVKSTATHPAAFTDEVKDLKSSKMSHNPNIVGMLFYHSVCKYIGKVLIIDDLYVMPQYRHQGLGTELMKETAEVALSSHCSEMELLVSDWNTKASDLYVRLGGKLLIDKVIIRFKQN